MSYPTALALILDSSLLFQASVEKQNIVPTFFVEIQYGVLPSVVSSNTLTDDAINFHNAVRGRSRLLNCI